MKFYEYPFNADETECFKALGTHYQELAHDIRFFTTQGSPELLEHFSPMARPGHTVTCPGFFGPQGREIRAKIHYPDMLGVLAEFTFNNTPITNFEMETAGIYSLSRILGHQACSISVIVAQRATKQFSSNVEKATIKMIKKALPLICNL